MKKHIGLSILLTVYEFARVFVIMTTRPESSIELLPLSWYAAVPLLFIPVVLTLFLYAENEYKAFAKKLYVLIKILSILSIIAYIIADYSYMVSAGPSNSYYSFKIFAVLLIILLFDGILCTIHLKSGEVYANNSNSQW